MKLATKPQHTGVQGVPLPVLRGPGEIGIPRRVRAAPGAFGTFLVEKYILPFFEKKEPKKLYNGKLRFPKRKIKFYTNNKICQKSPNIRECRGYPCPF